MTVENVGPVDATVVPRYAEPATFARLPRLDQVSRADVAVLGVPFDAGVSYRPGARFGPGHIRAASRLLRPFNPALDVEPFGRQQVADAGDVALNPFDLAEALKTIEAASDSLAKVGGRIIVIGSVLGLLPSRRDPLGGLIDAVLFMLVRETAMRLGSRKVRINGIALGAIGGTTGSKLLAGDEGFLSHAAAERLGRVQDVANAVLFLADPANTYMTGHILTVDGGWTAGFARDF